MLIVFAGPPCSGKSTLAAEVARRRGLPHLSMDATRQRILPGTHTAADRRAAYRAMHWAAELLLHAGCGAILDAPYRLQEDRDELSLLAAEAGAGYRLIECRVTPETAAARFRMRGYDPERPDLTEAVVAERVRVHPYMGAGFTLDTDGLTPLECLAVLENGPLRL